MIELELITTAKLVVQTMKILYKNPGFEHSIDSIMLFQTDNQTPYWSDALLYFYPQVEKQEIAKLNFEEKKKYVSKELYDVYQKEIKKEINEKVNTYNNHFLKHKDQIEDALSEAFDIDTRTIFNDLVGNITMNPVGPRFLKEHYFDVFYKNSERGAIGISIREPILETLDKYYRENKIHDFMEQSYKYCLEFEKDIRYHINEAEKEGL